MCQPTKSWLQNQVFIAERILRSIGSVLTGSDNSRESADDFSSDTETFASYLNAQLNGSADLGVERINDPEMRDSLTSIQSEYDAVLKSAAATVLKNSSQIVKVRQASSSIFEQSDALLSNLNKLSGGTGLAIAIPALGIILALIAFLFCVFKLLVLRGESDKNVYLVYKVNMTVTKTRFYVYWMRLPILQMVIYVHMQRYLKTSRVQLPTRLTSQLTNCVTLYRVLLKPLKRLHNIRQVRRGLPTS